MNFEVDVLAFGAHPDDVEIACGGTLAKLVHEGYSVAVVDMTSGEMGTRGTPKHRLEEAENARQLLGIKFRENLLLKDGNLTPTDESIGKTIVMLRKYRPKIVLFSPQFERHPDHEGLHSIIRKSMFLSGLVKYETQCEGENQKPWRIRKIYCYMQSYPFQKNPDFFVDISDFYEIKIKAIKCYASQVFVEGLSKSNEPQTRISRPEFFEELEARARYFGSLVGFKYAEPFYSVEPIGLQSLSKLF